MVVRNVPCDEILVLCEGWAASCLTLPDGRRQILAFLLPGDFLSPASLVRDNVGFSSLAVTDIQVSIFSRSAIRARLEHDAHLAGALHDCLADKLTEVDRLLAVVAQRSAEERVAYLVLHLTGRLKTRRPSSDDRYFFPLRQQDMAEALGLTSVHVSRVMTSFRTRGWLRLDNGVLEIANRLELERLGRLE